MRVCQLDLNKMEFPCFFGGLGFEAFGDCWVAEKRREFLLVS